MNRYRSGDFTTPPETRRNDELAAVTRNIVGIVGELSPVGRKRRRNRSTNGTSRLSQRQSDSVETLKAEIVVYKTDGFD